MAKIYSELALKNAAGGLPPVSDEGSPPRVTILR